MLPLGTVAPKGDLAAAVEFAIGHPQAAAAFLRRHRVAGLGLRRILAAVTDHHQLPPPLKDLAAWRYRLDDLLDAGWEELAVAVQETGVPTCGIKGLCMRREYARPADRDAGDIDVVVEGVDEAWKLGGWLRGHDYDWCEYEWPWLKRDLRTQKLYGQFQVWKPISGQYLRFDIHFGGYSVRHCRLAACAPAASGLTVIDPGLNLACLLGNSSGDFLIRLKDVNDIVVLVRTGQLSRETDLSVVEALGLQRFWNALVDRVLALTSLTVTEQETLQLLRANGLLRQRVPFGTPSFRARTTATVADAFLYGQALGGPIRGSATAWHAFRYYRRRHRLTVGKCHHRKPPDLIPSMTNETCVKLIPARLIPAERPPRMPRTEGSSPPRAIAGTAVLTEIVTDRHVFVAAGDERFVPAIFSDLCEFEAVGGLESPGISTP